MLVNLIACAGKHYKDNGNVQKLKYYEIQNRHDRIAVVDMIQFPISENDSMTIVPVYLWSDGTVNMNRDEAFEFTLPKTKGQPYVYDEQCGVWMMEMRTVKVNQRDFKIYKYANRTCSADGNGNWFYVPKIGLIVIYSVAWGNYEIMTDHPDYEPEILHYLANHVINDDRFLRDH